VTSQEAKDVDRLGVHLLALASIQNQLMPALVSAKRYPDDGLRWSLSNFMMVLVASFDDEWRALEGLAGRNETARQIVTVASPALKRVRRWPGIREVRNSFIAHARSKDGIDIADLPSIMGSGRFPTAYGEAFLVAELAVYAIAIAHHYGDAIHSEAAKKRGLGQTEIGSFGIKSWDEFRRDLGEIRAALLSADPTLEERFGRHPDDQQLN
jgi:hypothetical protein